MKSIATVFSVIALFFNKCFSLLITISVSLFKSCVKQVLFNRGVPSVKHSVSTWWQCCTEQLSPADEEEGTFHHSFSFVRVFTCLEQESLHSQNQSVYKWWWNKYSDPLCTVTSSTQQLKNNLL